MAEPQDAKFFLSVLHHIHDGKVNWAGVAQDNNIKYAKNATPKFNSMAKDYGYKWVAGQCVKVEGGEVAAKAPKTPRKKKPAGEVKTPVSAKKRKIEVVDEDEGSDDDAAGEVASDGVGSREVDGHEDGDGDEDQA